MFRQWKLGKQLAAMFAFPLVLVLIFMALLCWLFLNADAQTRRAEHSRSVISEAIQLQHLMTSAAQTLIAYSHNNNSKLLDKFDKTLTKIPDQCITLRGTIEDDPKEMEIVNRIESNQRRTVVMLRDVGRQVRSGGNLMQGVDGFNTSVDAIAEFTSDIGELIDAEKEKTHDSSEETEAQARQILKYSLMIGLPAVLGVAGAWFVIMQRSITGRLDRLMKNTDRVKHGQPLPPALQGADEIAELDQVFHQMVDSLNEAAQMKRELAAMITHDLRSPLASIQLCLQMSLHGSFGAVPQEMERPLNTAETSCKRLLQLINELLDIEKMEAGKMEMEFDFVPLAYVLESSVDAVHALADANNVFIVVPDVDQTIYADGDRLIQVLVNILSNAIKFSPAGAEVEIVVVAEEHYVRIEICDKGSGIPEEYKDSLFQKFKQVKTKHGGKKTGTGLGLVISKLIVEAHQGEIGFDSTVGKGTTFWLRLPLLQQSPTISTAKSPAPEQM